VPNNNNKEDT